MQQPSGGSLSRNWAPYSRHGGCYTGGRLRSVGGQRVACPFEDTVCILDTSSGLVEKVFQDELPEVRREAITAFAPTPDGELMVVTTKGLFVRVWEVETGKALRSWRAHKSPATAATCDPTGQLAATGGSDRDVFVFDIKGGFTTHSFSGHGGPIVGLWFHPDPAYLRLVSAGGGADSSIRVWDLEKSTCVSVLKDHFAPVAELAFSPCGQLAVSAGRDRVLNVWSTERKGGKGGTGLKLLSTQPLFETPESVTALQPEQASALAEASGAQPGKRRRAQAQEDEQAAFLVGGDSGLLRLWHVAASGQCRRGLEQRVPTGTVLDLADPDAAPGGHAADEDEDEDPGQSLASRSEARRRSETGAAVAASRQVACLLAPPAAEGAAAPPLLCAMMDHNIVKMVATPADADNEAPTSSVAAGAGSKRRRAAAASASSSSPLTRARLAFAGVLSGHTDEVTDVKFVAYEGASAAELSSPLLCAPAPARDATSRARAGGLPSALVAVATNSEAVRLMSSRDFGGRLLHGHAGAVVGLAVSPCGTLVASASRDRTCRLWDVATGACVAVLEGHQGPVSAVTWPRRLATQQQQGLWVATVSEDKSIKRWNLKASGLGARISAARAAGGASGLALMADLHASPVTARAAATAVAHDKSINCIDINPNDKMLATGSQDRTIKLWSARGLEPRAVLRGHRRGVWSVQFSPTEMVLASASGDRTVRLWDVRSESCVRTLEGHSGPVLNVKFLRRGQQLLSAGADGVMRLWGVRDSECVAALDEHRDRAWALCVLPPVAIEADKAGGEDEGQAEAAGGAAATAAEPVEQLVLTGGSDSQLVLWRDVTEQQAAEAADRQQEQMRKTVALFAAMSSRQYGPAIRLTLELEQPGRLRAILEELTEIGPTPPKPADPQKQLALLSTATPDWMVAMREGHQARQGFQVGHAATTAAARTRVDPTTLRAAEWSAAAGVPMAEVARPRAGAERGAATLAKVLRTLSPRHLGKLLGYVQQWNTQGRTSLTAHAVLHAAFRAVPREKLLALSSFRSLAASLLPYASRHASRIERLVQDTYYLDYVRSARLESAELEGAGKAAAAGGSGGVDWDRVLSLAAAQPEVAATEANEKASAEPRWADGSVVQLGGQRVVVVHADGDSDEDEVEQEGAQEGAKRVVSGNLERATVEAESSDEDLDSDVE